MLDTILAWLWPLPPVARAVLSVAAAWALPYTLRRWFPKVWRRIESWGPQDGKAAQVFLSIPSAMGGALMTALTSGGDPWRDTWMAILMPVAPLIHHALKAAPSVPYEGSVRDTDWRLARDVAARHAAWEASLEAAGIDPTKGGDDGAR